MVITREFLAQYVYLESQIKAMRCKLDYYKTHPLLTEHGIVKGSMGGFPFSECHFVVSAPKVKSDDERREAISQLLVSLEGNIQLYEDMKLDLECFIQTIQDLEMKEILNLKYIERWTVDQKKWTDDQIGKKLGYDRSTISRKIDNFLSGKCNG